jgi:phenylalanyl-tRNA synthetase beta chain
MQTSVRWINDYLDPQATEVEVADGLTRAGFPLDGRDEVNGDVALEIETTSNRGDCLCHVGLARELAAMTGRTLKEPFVDLKSGSTPTASLASVENREPGMCPLYTARIIRGVKVGPSPAWLADRLRAIGQIPRNNVVDATNFVLFELGQPTHVFDLNRLAGRKIIVRRAAKDERFQPLGEKAEEVRLATDDLVIADQERPVALAGVKGGALTAVDEGTVDLLLEAATFDPVAVRLSSRRHRIASDSSYRFERGVHAGQIDGAASRLADLILKTAGGELCSGVLTAGSAVPPLRRITLRLERCRAIIGLPIGDEEILRHLTQLGFAPKREGDRAACTVPAARLDIEREIDLVEEVARMQGLDTLPIAETLSVRVAPHQPRVAGRRATKDLLVGLGFVECITHSLIGESGVEHFVPAGASSLRIADERASAEPVLRPSVIPSLLRVRRHNQDNGVAELRLFEMASTFHRGSHGHLEVESLGLLMDAGDLALGARPLRGAIERLMEMLIGHGAEVKVEPATEGPAWLQPGGTVQAAGRSIGWIGAVAPSVQRAFGLDRGLLAAELTLDALLATYPPETRAHALPSFPAIERDLSVVVADDLAWSRVEQIVSNLHLDHMERVEFITTYRGKQLGAGKKSLTLKLRFRAADRTLRHDEADQQMARTIEALKSSLGAEVRS